MSSIPAFVTVRTSSTRLPNKCLLSFGDKNVLEHILIRCIDSNLNPIICTTKQPSDDIIAEIARKLKVKCFRGPEKNKLLRWLQCAEFFNFDAFTTVDADDPFFCPYEVKRSISLLSNKNYDMVIPYQSSSQGGAMVGYSIRTKIIKRALSGLEDENKDTEMAWSFLNNVPNIKIEHLIAPTEYEVSARMTLDYWEDYIFLESLRLILGKDTSRKNICRVLRNNPELCSINEFRTDEWSKIQKQKSFNGIN